MVKKLLLLFGALVALGCLIFWVGLTYFAPKYLRQTIQEKGSAALGGELQLSELKIHWGLPSKITITQLRISKPNKLLVEIPSLSLSLNLKDGLLQFNRLRPVIHIDLESPQATFFTTTQQEAKTPPAAGPANPAANILSTTDPKTAIKLVSSRLQDLEFRFSIKNGQLKLNQDQTSGHSFTNIACDLHLPSLSEALLVKLSGQLKVNHPLIPFFIPIKVSSQLKLDQGVLNLGSTEISVLSINTKSEGSFDLKNKHINARLALDVPELEKLPFPSIESLPIKNWKGSLKGYGSIRGSYLDPMIDGSAQLKSAEFQVDFKNPKINADGVLKADLEAQFVKDKANPLFRFPSLKWNIDLEKTALTLPLYFQKDKNTPLNSQGTASFAGDLQLEQLKLKLAQIELSATGRFSPTASSKLRVEVKPTTLAGLERMIHPLAKFPVQGSLALKSEIEGHLADPKKLKINLEMLKLEKVSTAVDFKTADLFVRGPVKLDLNGKLSVDQLLVKAGHVTLFSDLTGLEVKFKDQFKKASGEIAKVSLTATKTGDTLALKQSQIEIPQGVMNITGTPPITVNAPMDLNLQIKSLDLGKLGIWLPKFAKMIPEGHLTSNLQIKGSLNSEDFMKSPLAIHGQLTANLPKYIFRSEKTAPNPKEKPSEPKPAEPFLPDSLLIRQLRLDGKITLGQLELEKFVARGITSQITLADSRLAGSAQIKNIFDGNVQVDRISLPLTQPDPEIQFALKTQDIRLEQVTKAFVPEYEKLATGLATIGVSGHTRMPGTPAFLDNLQAMGTLNVNQCVLNTVHLSEILKDLIQKIPGAKSDMLSSRGPMQSEVKSNFTLKNGQIELKPFDAITTRKEQILVTGTANLKMDLNLKGSLFLVDQFVGGSFFEANKDSLGRLEIPLHIRGNAMKPEFKFAQETISIMLGKTFEFEKRKFAKKAEDEVKKELQTKVDQAKVQAQKQLEQKKAEAQNKIAEELKKKAQQLFK